MILPKSERTCDRCVAPAQTAVRFKNGDYLLLCGHHFNVSRVVLYALLDDPQSQLIQLRFNTAALWLRRPHRAKHVRPVRHHHHHRHPAPEQLALIPG